MAPTFLPNTLTDLLWVVLVTDSVLKLITIECKAILAILPASTIAYARRVSYYFKQYSNNLSLNINHSNLSNTLSAGIINSLELF